MLFAQSFELDGKSQAEALAKSDWQSPRANTRKRPT
jgi:hypothetical protein